MKKNKSLLFSLSGMILCVLSSNVLASTTGSFTVGSSIIGSSASSCTLGEITDINVGELTGAYVSVDGHIKVTCPVNYHITTDRGQNIADIYTNELTGIWPDVVNIMVDSSDQYFVTYMLVKKGLASNSPDSTFHYSGGHAYTGSAAEQTNEFTVVVYPLPSPGSAHIVQPNYPGYDVGQITVSDTVTVTLSID